jgi:hypothetical protein
MKWLNRLSALLFTLISAKGIMYLIDRYEFLIFDKNNLDEYEQKNENQVKEGIDFRGQPSHICICGSEIWNVRVVFEDHEIATYFLDMECAHCGSLATAPTPVDKGM